MPARPPAGADLLRVVLADGDADFVEKLRAGLEADARVEVVGAAKTTAELLDLVEVLAPDLALVDLELGPDGAGDAIRRIGTHSPTLVLVLFSEEGSADVPRPGAAGYIRKDSGINGLQESFFELASLIGALSRRPPRS